MPSKIRNSLLWILEPFDGDETFLHKQMFGCDAAYIDGLLCLVIADRNEPWNGLLVCTSQDRHEALMEELPACGRTRCSANGFTCRRAISRSRTPEAGHRTGVCPRWAHRRGAEAVPEASARLGLEVLA